MTKEYTTVSAAGRATQIAFAALAVIAAAGPAVAATGSASPLAQVAADPRPWTQKVAPEVVAQAAATSGTVDILVKLREPEGIRALSAVAPFAPARLRWIADTADGLESDWSAGGVLVLHRYPRLASAHVALPAALLAAFAEDPRVDAVVPDRKVHKLDATGSAYMHVNAIQPPNTGAGVGIAILDTGVDFTHAELAPVGTKTIALFDAYHTAGDAAYAKDDDGHGTEVAGIAGATGVKADAIGTAPAATIVSVKVLDSTGSGTEHNIVAGIDAILASVSAGNPYNIRAANFSLGGYFTGPGISGAAAVPDQPCDSQDAVLADAFQQLTTANVIPVVASGNGSCTVGVEWPACISTSIAVGSVYDQSFQYVSFGGSLQCGASGTTGCKDTLPNPGTIACYTDSGDKLDVWAPTGAVTTTMGGGYSSDNTSSPYFFGTSASTPFVSGLVALLAQASPTTSAAGIKTAIVGTGTAITDPRNNVTRNVVQADRAVAALSCPPPAAPSSLAANLTAACAGESVILSWGAVSGADSYTVQSGTDSAFSGATSATTTSTSYTFSTTLAVTGTFYFRVQATSSCGASGWSNVVQVSYSPDCAVTYTRSYFLSGIAHLPGVSPAVWHSDVSILNAGTTPADIRVTFYGVNSFPPAFTATLGGNQQIAWTDVLASLFGLSQDKGMIVVNSTAPLQMLSRTYSTITSGSTVTTFGQSYVGVEAGQALTTASNGWFPGLRSDGAFRTNLEFVNASAVPTDVRVSFYNASGSPLATTTVNVPALRWVQVVRALPSGQASAFAKVQVLAGGAQILGSASVIDGNSTDPTTIPMWVQ